jgi:hypothetical protein
MKTIIIRMQKSSRWLAILLAAVVAIITSAVVANATQTITTPNAVSISYNLAAGANSAAITPASSRSVLVMGCDTDGADQGVGLVSLLRSPLASAIEWAGYESYSPVAFTGGSSVAAGTHIVWIDGGHHVDIQVASGATIVIHNGHTVTRAGNVTLIW